MELKYYLRGLGLGILVTAIIMSIAASKKRAMTDDEIIARAKQLGMIEDSVLTEINAKEDMTEEDTTEEDITGADILSEDQDGKPGPDTDIDAGEKTADVEVASRDTEIEDTDSQDNNTEEAVPESNEDVEPVVPESNEDVGPVVPETDEDTESTRPEPETTDRAIRGSAVITIGKGDGSYTVSKKLEEAGVIPSAGDYDTFLCANGFDKRIRSGTFTIPADASDEQIARIITGIE